jgi:NADPH-dependent glutamate synthase beta subunit-like oxidoreductase
VVIAGGGVMVPKAVRRCRELGAETVTVISRKAPENTSYDAETMEKIRKDGATVVYNTGITRLHGEEDRLTHVEYTELDTGVKHLLEAETLFIASGCFPELVFIQAPVKEGDGGTQRAPGAPLRWEGIEIYKEPVNRREVGLLSRGDTLTGYSAAVAAINGGRKAAASIHNIMHGIFGKYPANLVTKQSVLQGVNHLEGVQVSPRNIMPAASIRNRGKEELFKGFSLEAARSEADRCLRCGLICYERSKIGEGDKAENVA